MKPMIVQKPTMIITDLDDTLLTSDKRITDYTVDILEKCRAAGIKIVFATARSMQAAQRYFSQFMPDVFAGYGGALVMAGETIIHRFDISADIAGRLIAACKREPAVKGIHAINESVAFTNHSGIDTSYYQPTDFSGESKHHYLKVSVAASDPAAVERIAAEFPMCDMLRYSGEDLYRFANVNAVKWQAIKAIAAHYGYDTSTFIAFGDDINDLEMIQNCGMGIAVKNAVPAVLSAAQYICDTNENEGVAKWLEENLLKK